MGEAARKRVTIDEFLAFEGEGDRRYELVAGEIVAMAPATDMHSIIAGKAIASIGQRLKPPCKVMSGAGISLPWHAYYQADVAFTGSPVLNGQWGKSNPIVLIEILSPRTEAHDRGRKLFDYRHVPSIQEIVLIASDEKQVELWRRGPQFWTVTELSAEDVLRLDSIGCDIPVGALYDGLDFSADAAAAR